MTFAVLSPALDSPAASSTGNDLAAALRNEPTTAVQTRTTPERTGYGALAPRSAQDTQIAFALPAAGAIPIGYLAAAGALILGAAYLQWKINENPEVIASAARELQQKFTDTAWALGKMGIDMAVPTLQQLERQIGELFRSVRDGATSMGDMANRLIERIWPGSQDSSGGTVTGSAAAPVQRPAVTTPTTAPVTPAQTAPVTALPAATPLPVALSDLPIGRQQIALNQSGVDNTQTASQWMAKGSALLPGLNESLRQFYFDAAGGAAARTQGLPQRSIAQVRQFRDQLTQIINGSNDAVAGIQTASRALQRIHGNPANAGQLFPDLSQSITGLNQAHAQQSTARNDFKALVNRLDTWLSQAYEHAADGFQALPAPPLPALSPAGTDANAVASGLQTAAQSAQQSLNASNAQRSQPAPVMPSTRASVPTAPAGIGWFDPATGAFSGQRAGAGAMPVNAHFVDRLPGTGQRMTMNVEGEPVDVEVVGPTPGPGSNSGSTASNSTGQTFNVYIENVNIDPGQPGGGDKGPNWRQRALAALVTGMLAAPGAYFVNRTAEGERMGTLQPDFVNADKSAQTLLGGLGPNSSEAQIKDVREAVWRSYFEAGNAELQAAKWLPIGGGGVMFSSTDMHNIRAEQERFLVDLRSQPVPSRNGGEVGLGSFNRAPVLEGDPLKTQHFNSVMQKVNAEVRQQLVLMPGRTAGDDKVSAFTPRPFDVDAYVRDHRSELVSDAGRKQAHIALWRHHLDQLLPALGNARVTHEQRQALRIEAERWLSSERLDPSQLILLPGNADAQPVLASVVAAARRDADRLQALMPQRTSLLDQMRQTPRPAATPNSALAPAPQSTPQTQTQGATPAPVRDAETVLGDVNRTVAEARLTTPPQATGLEQVRFDPEMFFMPDEPRTAAAIDAAKLRANNLFNAIKTIGLANPTFNASFTQLLNAFNADVLTPLGEMHPQEQPRDESLLSPSTPATQE